MPNTYHKHFHKRKRQKAFIDKYIYLAVIIGPLMTLPQVYDIWIKGSREVSIISWVSYLFVAVIWLFYGIKHREKPIILVQLIWIVLDLMIIFGLLTP